MRRAATHFSRLPRDERVHFVSATITEKPQDSLPDEIEPILDERFALGWKHILVTAAFGCFFVYLSYIPLFHTDIWGHVHYGQWMIENRALPAEDPFLPLSEGMDVVGTAWLSQIVLGWISMNMGPEGLSLFFTLTIWTTYLIYTQTFYLMSGRLILAATGSFLTFFLFFGRHSIIRPEIFGGLCFAILLWMVIRGEPWRSRSVVLSRRGDAGDEGTPWLLWIGIPLLFVCWANGHGSFMIGLIVLGCHAVGRILEVAWKEWNPLAVLQDKWVIRWILMTELAFVATLINPYGIDLLIESALFSQNENLKDILEWYSLQLVDAEGIQFALVVLLWIGLYRSSRQRVALTDLILLLVFATGMAMSIRIIAWFAGIYSLCMMPHITDTGTRILGEISRRWGRWYLPLLSRRKFGYSLICLLIVWVSLAVSPFGGKLLGARTRFVGTVYSDLTPIGITNFLRESPPTGLVYAPQWWSDWIVLEGPPGVRTVVSTNVHMAPKRVWEGYMQVSKGRDFWDAILERWRVETLVVDTEEQEKLAELVRGSGVWKIVYEDEYGFVARHSEAE
jgi:hypothetical protein